MREARDRECNTRAKDVGGISEDISNTRKELERGHDEEGTDGDTFMSSEAEIRRHAYNIYGVR